MIKFTDGVITKEGIMDELSRRMDEGLSVPRAVMIKEQFSGEELEIPFDWVFSAVGCPARLLARMWYLKEREEMEDWIFVDLIMSLKKGK